MHSLYHKEFYPQIWLRGLIFPTPPNSRRTITHPIAAPIRTTSNPTSRTLNQKESKTDQLAKILAASKEEYCCHQEELGRREEEELERVRIKSEEAEKLE
ncbi:uncharacterized protein PGTG_00363 [Puccinia graminis f. sp. tritici CRL 75-36-700-3]|uniref:Uncharacterized protein n=1 Tax=Puccinia graminis f. sp. tritici (strain CRL 75-36-700-3 / race SCCL) TaxID=418459 RepID=E3JQU5_PUCGT|nr:uncharacterized protein PGTG_00363 [Puccinia graminis f. sp. tritici CRL 75-36-700-3]EFP74407.1 hypothetical protein PGTG_00363 [Puccinia graminis f. sp. tritici CRL 75-36-700-3]